LAGPYNGIRKYDIDICANNEDQAKAPFDDLWDILENSGNRKKFQRHFYWNKEEIVSLKTGAKIKYRTNNPKGKDGLRSGEVVFNEIHQYPDYQNINVFTTGLGKKRHPRRLYATTNGDVRDGPLDHYLERSKEILKGAIPDNGWLPFICMLDDREEVHDPKNWEKPNPSLPYRPDLRTEIEKEYQDWKMAPSQFTAFMTKRMNSPEGNPDIEVTSWENILMTNRPIPDLSGCTGVGAIDYAQITDFASAGVLVKTGGIRYWVTHSWMCRKSKDIWRLKIPYEEWEKAGYLTIVEDVQINPELIADWLEKTGQTINIEKICIDGFRYALVMSALRRIGFDAKEKKNVKLVRPSDIIKVVPVIDSAFANAEIVWGDDPLMRWYTNNTKKVPASGRVKQMTGSDEFGNYVYGKIEPKSRKTDGFTALVAAMTEDGNLPEEAFIETPDLPAFTF
jgi:phage terminase large subunit-like protein